MSWKNSWLFLPELRRQAVLLDSIKQNKPRLYECVILGGGIAGCTAALYLSQANIGNVVVAGPSLGSLQESPEIRNWPTLVKVPGYQIMEASREQIVLSGSWVLPKKEVIDVDFSDGPPFKIWYQDSSSSSSSEREREREGEGEREGSQVVQIEALSVIIAMGSKARRHSAANIDRLWGNGVYSCAVCDGSKYKGKSVAVIGGGDSAVGTVAYLMKLASKVFIILRGDQWKAKDKKALAKVLSQPNVQVLMNRSLVQVNARDEDDVSQGVSSVWLVDHLRKKQKLAVDGVFLSIGADPLTDMFADTLELDEDKFIVVDEFQQTSIPGIFAVGEICTSQKYFKQAITSSADGCRASFGVRDFLTSLPDGIVDLAEKKHPPVDVQKPQDSKTIQILEKQVGQLAGVSSAEERLTPSREGHRSSLSSRDNGFATAKSWNEVLSKYLSSSKTPVLIDLYSPNCGPCRDMLDIIPKMVQQDRLNVQLVKVNVDEHPEEADKILSHLSKSKTELTGLPTILIVNPSNFKTNIFVGKKSAEVLKQSIREVANSSSQN